MKSEDNVQDFISRVLDLVYKPRKLKDDIPAKMMVSKLLRCLTPRFKHVVHSIVEAKDLNTPTVDELSSSFKSHKSLLNLASEEDEEKVLHVKSSPLEEQSGHDGRGGGCGFHKGRRMGR